VTDEQRILDRIRALIESGQHRDEVPGRPGVALGGGGTFREGRRLYLRGTEEYSAAAVSGLLDRLPPPPPPAGDDALHEAESLVGATFPPLLAELYRIANGGFGPGYGLLGLRGGFQDDTGRTAVDLLAEVPKGRWPGMPNGLLPLCHWGCAIYSFLHVPSERIYGWDPNPVPPTDDIPFFEQEYVLRSWLNAWLDTTLQPPLLLHDPATARYRGATIEETVSAMSEDAD
jgi:hypothetical protein